MINAGGLVVEHHVLHLHDDGAVAVVGRVLEGLVGLLVVIELDDVEEPVAEVPGQRRQRATRIPAMPGRSSREQKNTRGPRIKWVFGPRESEW